MAYTYPLLTGGQLLYTEASGASQFDVVDLTGSGNTVVTGYTFLQPAGGANESITGANLLPIGWDTNTTVQLGATAAKGVTIDIELDGSANTVGLGVASGSSGPVGYGPGWLNEANVTVMVNTNGNWTPGGNSVTLDNDHGTSTITLPGPSDTVYVNDTAANTITTGQNSVGYGGAKITITQFADDFFNFAQPAQFVYLSGSGNTVTAVTPDNVTVDPATDNNTVTLGDGNNNVTLTGSNNVVTSGNGNDNISTGGTHNKITDGNGNDTVDAGTGYATVTLGNGEDVLTAAGGNNNLTIGGGDNTVTVGPGNNNAILVAAPFAGGPNAPGFDVITFGVGTGNSVKGIGGVPPDENFQISGGTGAATYILGNGDNQVIAGGGGNTITEGDGADSVGVSGNTNAITLGNGNDLLQLGLSAHDVVSIGNGNDAVTGGGSNNKITGGNGTDKVNMVNGGFNTIALGNGTDTVIDQGRHVSITVGNGNDNISAKGDGDTIVAGTGNNVILANGDGDHITVTGASTIPHTTETITANGSNDVIKSGVGTTTDTTLVANGISDTITLGDGNNTDTSNGFGDTIVIGNGNNNVTANGSHDKITLGNGTNTLSATGVGDTINVDLAGGGTSTITAGSGSTINVGPGTTTLTAGDGNTISVGAGKSTITVGANDSVTVSGATLGSAITLNGNADTVFLKSNSNETVNFSPTGTGGTVEVFASGGNYSGAININGLDSGFTSPANVIDLQGVTGLTNYGQVVGAIHVLPGAAGWELPLPGGGKIDFAEAGGFPQSTNFAFS